MEEHANLGGVLCSGSQDIPGKPLYSNWATSYRPMGFVVPLVVCDAEKWIHWALLLRHAQVANGQWYICVPTRRFLGHVLQGSLKDTFCPFETWLFPPN